MAKAYEGDLKRSWNGVKLTAATAIAGLAALSLERTTEVGLLVLAASIALLLMGLLAGFRPISYLVIAMFLFVRLYSEASVTQSPIGPLSTMVSIAYVSLLVLLLELGELMLDNRRAVSLAIAAKHKGADWSASIFKLDRLLKSQLAIKLLAASSGYLISAMAFMLTGFLSVRGLPQFLFIVMFSLVVSLSVLVAALHEGSTV